MHVATTVATTADVDTIAARHADLKSADLLPDQHLVDAGYLGVDHVLEARADQGVKLIGPLPPDSGWQARDQDGLDRSRFCIDWDRKQVTCPTARPAATGTKAAAARPVDRAGELPRRRPYSLPRPGWLHPLAHPCPRPDVPPARPVQGPAPPARRAGNTGWRACHAHRAGVQGTIAQAAHRGDLHQTRHRGLAKTHPQHVLTALALNLVRVDAWLTGTPLGGSWLPA